MASKPIDNNKLVTQSEYEAPLSFMMRALVSIWLERVKKPKDYRKMENGLQTTKSKRKGSHRQSTTNVLPKHAIAKKPDFFIRRNHGIFLHLKVLEEEYGTRQN